MLNIETQLIGFSVVSLLGGILVAVGLRFTRPHYQSLFTGGAPAGSKAHDAHKTVSSTSQRLVTDAK